MCAADLAPVEIQHLPDKDLDSLWIPQCMHLGEGLKVDIVGRVERLRHAKNQVGDRRAPS